jgi:hypothetical protein
MVWCHLRYQYSADGCDPETGIDAAGIDALSRRTVRSEPPCVREDFRQLVGAHWEFGCIGLHVSRHKRLTTPDHCVAWAGLVSNE